MPKQRRKVVRKGRGAPYPSSSGVAFEQCIGSSEAKKALHNRQISEWISKSTVLLEILKVLIKIEGGTDPTAVDSPDLGGSSTEPDFVNIQAEEFPENDNHVFEDVEDNEPWEADRKNWWNKVYRCAGFAYCFKHLNSYNLL